MDIARGISLKGLGLDRLWPQAAILLVYGATVLVVASVIFSRKRD
jgi:hypothetical protein